MYVKKVIQFNVQHLMAELDTRHFFSFATTKTPQCNYYMARILTSSMAMSPMATPSPAASSASRRPSSSSVSSIATPLTSHYPNKQDKA